MLLTFSRLVMEATVQRLDISHELSFAQPAFPLAGNTSDIIQIFYETIAPRYPIAAEHIAVSASSTLSQLLIRIGLFANAAALELRAERMILRFSQVVGHESLAIVKDTVILAHDALRKAVPGVRGANASFLVNAWLVLDGGSGAAQELLRDHANPRSPIDPKLLGAQGVAYTVRANLQNPSEKWDVQIVAEPSAIPQAHLFVMTNLSFRAGATFNTIDQQISFAEQLVPKIFDSLGIKLKTSPSESRK
jgi:hypothetical protein